MDQNDEHTFLCGYQRIRRYGSTQDLNSPSTSFKKPFQFVVHKVEPSDTLQSLELKYNSNILHCKTSINIPIYDGVENQRGGVVSPEAKVEKKRSLEVVEEKQESLDDFFRRIDSNVKKTQKVVKRLNKKNP
ncbi:hypothetical protein FO519_008099 [Halicephalobus sp. NKZ332]|nr:hypothetical protein FO519_008099 [Halicephalobus sp. NKZ332]